MRWKSFASNADAADAWDITADKARDARKTEKMCFLVCVALVEPEEKMEHNDDGKKEVDNVSLSK